MENVIFDIILSGDAMTIKEKTVAEQVKERLRSDILSGYFQEGQRITIKEIADRYGVSAMPVRESFQMLTGERLLEMLPYRGAIVLPLDKNYVKDFFAVAVLVESHFCAKACEEGVSQRSIVKMETLYKKMLKHCNDEDTAEYIRLNLEFHKVGITACDNQKATELFDEYARTNNALRHRYVMKPNSIQKSMKQHEEMIECYRNRDGERLRKLVMEHRNQASEDILNTVIWWDE